MSVALGCLVIHDEGGRRRREGGGREEGGRARETHVPMCGSHASHVHVMCMSCV